MHFTAETSRFAHVLREVGTVVKRREIDALNGYLIVAKDGEISVTGSDMDRQFTQRFKAEIHADGGAVINADKLRALISALAEGGQVELTAQEGRVSVVSGGSKFRLATLPEASFPLLPFGDASWHFAMDKPTLAAMVAASHAAADATDARMRGMHSVFLTEDGGKLHALSSDGSRLARWVTDAPATEGLSLMLPIPALEMLDKFDEIRAEFTEGKMRVAHGDIELIAKLIDAQFPGNYRSIIDGAIAGTAFETTVDAVALRDALARLDIISDDKDRLIYLDFSHDVLTIKPVRAHTHEGSEEIALTGRVEPLRTAMSSMKIRQALDALDTDFVRFALIGTQDPLRITAETRPGALVLIMAAAA